VSLCLWADKPVADEPWIKMLGIRTNDRDVLIYARGQHVIRDLASSSYRVSRYVQKHIVRFHFDIRETSCLLFINESQTRYLESVVVDILAAN